jgi:hypothetical protein
MHPIYMNKFAVYYLELKETHGKEINMKNSLHNEINLNPLVRAAYLHS